MHEAALARSQQATGSARVTSSLLRWITDAMLLEYLKYEISRDNRQVTEINMLHKIVFAPALRPGDSASWVWGTRRTTP
eukprot:364640-Chlamydomonas_euryale.AAC.3